MFNRGNVLIIIAFGILLFAVFYFIYTADALIPQSVIKTVQDENGYYLICDGNCNHFEQLQLNHTLRFCTPYQAINYMYDVINSKENLHLGPLTAYGNNTICNR